jgi:DNA-binding Xre family transcriptional regulator
MHVERSETMIEIHLEAYLDGLRSKEGYKRARDRQSVPSYTELAAESGISPVTLSRIANGHIKHFSLDTLDAIIEALRRRGFQTEVGDLLAYHPHHDADIQSISPKEPARTYTPA